MPVLAFASWVPPGGSPAPPNPPLPSPIAPTVTGRAAPVPAIEALPVEEVPKTRRRPARVPAPPRIVLGEKHESNRPVWSGAGIITSDKPEVKAVGGRLTAVLTGVADSHAFFGVPSASLARYQLVQEFEIVAGGATTAATQEIIGQPWSVPSRLTERLVWSLGTVHHYRHLLEAPPG